jgi:hypothetical protein
MASQPQEGNAYQPTHLRHSALFLPELELDHFGDLAILCDCAIDRYFIAIAFVELAGFDVLRRNTLLR